MKAPQESLVERVNPDYGGFIRRKAQFYSAYSFLVMLRTRIVDTHPLVSYIERQLIDYAWEHDLSVQELEIEHHPLKPVVRTEYHGEELNRLREDLWKDAMVNALYNAISFAQYDMQQAVSDALSVTRQYAGRLDLNVEEMCREIQKPLRGRKIAH